MQIAYVAIATVLTSAALFYIEDQRRASAQKEPASLATKGAIFFFLLLIFCGVFYWFDESIGGDGEASGGSGQGAAARVAESTRVRGIPEDCHDGIPPF